MAVRGPIYRNIYGDETSHIGGHKYLVYGTVNCRTENVDPILARLRASLGDNTFERGWSDNRFTHLYEDFVRAIFECRDKYDLKFRCIVADTHSADYRQHNKVGPALGLEKLIFTHLMTYARNHAKSDARLNVYLDKRSSKYTSEVQKITLNRRDKLEHRRSYDLFEICADVESDEVLLVQVADLLAGAVAWVWNERYLNAKQHKSTIGKLIAKLANIPIVDGRLKGSIRPGDLLTLRYPTLPFVGNKGFDIWLIDWKEEQVKDYKAKSLSQLTCFAPDMTFADINSTNVVDMICPRCEKQTQNFLAVRPGFGRRRLDDEFRPPCGTCIKHTKGVVLLRPAPNS
jgi:Protein of unknown function (DUF3800)